MIIAIISNIKHSHKLGITNVKYINIITLANNKINFSQLTCRLKYLFECCILIVIKNKYAKKVERLAACKPINLTQLILIMIFNAAAKIVVKILR